LLLLLAAPLATLLAAVRAFPLGVVIVDNNSNRTPSMVATIVVAALLVGVPIDVFIFFLIFM
jgi:hypothetical protein